MMPKPPLWKRILRLGLRVFHLDALVIVVLLGGWVLIAAAANLGLQRRGQQWLPVNLKAHIAVDYTARQPETLQLARVDPRIIEAVKQDNRANPVIAAAAQTSGPAPASTITPAPTTTAVSVNTITVSAGGPYSGAEGSPILLQAGRVSSVLGLVPGAITYRWDLDGDGRFDEAEGESTRVVFYDEGNYTVAVQATDLVGRTATDRAAVRVTNVPPLVNVGPDRFAAEAEEIRFSAAAQDPGHDILLFEWDFGDGAPVVVDTLQPKHTYTDNGVYIVRLRVSDNDGGLTQSQLTVFVDNLPPEVNAGPDQTVNEGQVVAFNGNAKDPSDFDSLTYVWDFDYDGNTFTPNAVGPTASTLYPNGPRNVVAALLVQDEDGGRTIDTLNVTVNNVAPTITGVSNTGPVGEGDPLTLSVTAVDAGNDPLTYAFDWQNDGAFDVTGAAAQLSNIWYNQGNYTVRIRVDDGDGGEAFTTTTVSTFNRPPVAVANADTVGLEGDLLRFDASDSTDPGLNDVLTYTWRFGDGATASGIAVSHPYGDNGVYAAGLTVADDSNASSTVPLSITILNANPIANAGPDLVIDEGTDVRLTFDGTATRDPGILDILAYAWDFDYDGNTFNEEAAGALAEHLYPGFDGPAEFIVALRVRDDDYPYPTTGGGEIGESIDTLKVTVENIAPWNVNTGGPYRTTAGVPVLLNASGIDVPGDLPLTFEWDLDYDGIAFTVDATGQTITHTWPAGLFNIALQVKDNDGASSQAFTTVDAGRPPTAAAVVTPTLVLEGDPVLFDGTGSGDPDGDPLSYLWDFGDGSPLTAGITVTHVFTDNGVFTATLRVDDGRGGVDTTTAAPVTVNNAPPVAVPAATPNPAPEGSPVTLDGSNSTDPGAGDTLTYEWDFNYNGVTFNVNAAGRSVAATYPDGPAAYTVALRVSDDDGAVSPVNTLALTISNAPPIANAGPDQSVLEGDTVNLDGSGSTDPGLDALTLFEWDFDYDGVTFTVDATGQTATTVYPNGPAAYTVGLRVTDEDGDASAIATANITVNNAPPTANAGPDKTVNRGDIVTFDGSGSTDPGPDPLTFAWDFDYDGITFNADAAGAVVTHTWVTTGTFTVMLQVDDGQGGIATDTATVQVN